MKLADGFLCARGHNRRDEKFIWSLADGNAELPVFRNEVRLKMAQVYLEEQKSTNASAQLKAIADDGPANGQVYYLLGRLAYDVITSCRKRPRIISTVRSF